MFSVRRPSWFARRRFSRPKPGLNVRPNLEVLEDRCAPSGMPFNTQTSIHLSQAYNLFHLNETVSGQVFVPDIVPGGVSGGTVTITDGGQTRTVPINGDGTYSTTFDFNLFQGPPIKAHPVTVTYNGGGQISTPAPSPVPATDPVTAQADDTSFQYAATVLTDLYILSRFVGGPPGSQ